MECRSFEIKRCSQPAKEHSQKGEMVVRESRENDKESNEGSLVHVLSLPLFTCTPEIK
jgi:hypothetical protein